MKKTTSPGFAAAPGLFASNGRPVRRREETARAKAAAWAGRLFQKRTATPYRVIGRDFFNDIYAEVW